MATIVSPLREYRPLYADAYEALRDAILNGRLPAGERIVESEIARQMEISRGPIREAIRKLEQEGLVEAQPRRGVVVVKLSSAEVMDVYQLRTHLERFAVRRAVERLTEADLGALELLIAQMHQHAENGDLRQLINADVEFHRSICRVAASKPLLRTWDSLNPYSWTLLTSFRAPEYGPIEIAERHRVVLAALRLRDPDRAEAEISRHILELAEHVVAHLAEDEPAGSGARV